MPWAHLAVAAISAGFLSSLTDWFFAGDWLHRRFTYPEVWRTGSEQRAIALTIPLPFVTCAAFLLLCAALRLHSLASAAELAAAIWVIGPLPLILTNAAFMKLHRVFVVSHAAGWLVKLLIASVAADWLVR